MKMIMSETSHKIFEKDIHLNDVRLGDDNKTKFGIKRCVHNEHSERECRTVRMVQRESDEYQQ